MPIDHTYPGQGDPLWERGSRAVDQVRHTMRTTRRIIGVCADYRAERQRLEETEVRVRHGQLAPYDWKYFAEFRPISPL